ncbi:MAG TPA: hypothetical protein VNK96_02555 [Fimbriimonadales bacterium]|nr:hypothetical protein [Fimbriimonadales bacterium]
MRGNFRLLSSLIISVAVCVLASSSNDALGDPADKLIWKRYTIGRSVANVELPSKPSQIDLPLSAEVKNAYSHLETYQMIHGTFVVHMSYGVLRGNSVNLDAAAEGALNQLLANCDEKNSKYSAWKGKIQGREARYFGGYARFQGQHLGFYACALSEGGKFWQVICTYMPTQDNERFAKKTINSIKFAK